MAETAFDFQKFVEDSKNVLTKPKEYFTSMPKTGGLVEPIIKALIYGSIAGFFSMLWIIFGFNIAGSFLGQGFGVAAGITVLISTIIGSVIGLFIGGIIILIISAICGGSTDFEANVRVSAALMVLSPINSILSITSGLSIYLGGIISLLVALYGLWLLYNAIVNALGGKEGTAKIVAIILAVIPVLMLISTLLCTRMASSITNQYMKNSTQQSREAKKAMDDFKKLMQEAQKRQK